MSTRSRAGPRLLFIHGIKAPSWTPGVGEGGCQCIPTPSITLLMSLGHHQQAEFLSKTTLKLRHFLGQLWRAETPSDHMGSPRVCIAPSYSQTIISPLSLPKSMNIHWVIVYITSILSNTILERSSIKFQSDCENHKSNRTTMWCWASCP